MLPHNGQITTTLNNLWLEKEFEDTKGGKQNP